MYCIVCVCSGKRITPDQFALEYMLASFDTLGGGGGGGGGGGIFIPHSHYMSVNVDYYIFIKPHACQWIPYMVAQHVSLNLAIQDVASMAAKICSLGSLCKL